MAPNTAEAAWAGDPERPTGAGAVTTAGEVLFRPVRAGNAFEETVERLLTAIKLGIVAPGSRLPSERELADRLGVSRVTLREAIGVLQESGYVESRRGRYGGTFVLRVLPKLTKPVPQQVTALAMVDLDDTLTLRQVLEVGAAEEAAARSSVNPGSDDALLVACAVECGQAGDQTEYRRLDSRFHLAVAEAAGSASLTAAVAQARMRVNTLLDAIPVLERNMAHSEEQHHRIVAAIQAGDRAAARLAMAEHLAATAALLRGFLG